MNKDVRLKRNFVLFLIFISQILSLTIFFFWFQNSNLNFAALMLLLFSSAYLLLIHLEAGVIFYILEATFLLLLFALTRYPWSYRFYYIGVGMLLGSKYFFQKKRLESSLNSLRLDIESLKERINLNHTQHLELIRINDALEKRIARFTDLRKFSEEIIASLDLNELLQIIARKALEIIGRGEACLIYLFDRKSEALSLASSFTLSSRIKIRAKRGDPCEYWVFRQRVPLLITDILRDFRFDSEEVLSYGREFRSLISTPIISRNKFLGLIRIDSPSAEGFTADDLRLLDIIADLSAIAIDNAFLFRKMETLATHDSLTGFYLRREFINIIQKKKEESSLKEEIFSLLMLDIDDFKSCNDRFGHIAGDMVLKNISQLIRAHLVEEEYPCRYGGEEFLLFIKGRNRENLIQRAELIRGAVEASLLKIRRQLIKVTISIGIAIFPQDGSQIKELIEVADARLYKAKKAGKNRVVYD